MMASDYALILSYSGIQLVERPGGSMWYALGSVPLDAADLKSDMAALRNLIAADADQDAVVRLVLPNEQIRYMQLPRDAGSVDGVRAALDGATPYALEDLEFDFEIDAAGTHVAATARETLNEAAQFARNHGFLPLCFTAIPKPESFTREVFFGLTPEAEGIVTQGRFLGPDDTPITVSDQPRPVFDPRPDVAPEAVAHEEETSGTAPDDESVPAPGPAIETGPVPPQASSPLFASRSRTTADLKPQDKAPRPAIFARAKRIGGRDEPSLVAKPAAAAVLPPPPESAKAQRPKQVTPPALKPDPKDPIFADFAAPDTTAQPDKGQLDKDQPDQGKATPAAAPITAGKGAVSPGAAAFESSAAASVMPIRERGNVPETREAPWGVLGFAALVVALGLGLAYLLGAFGKADHDDVVAPAPVIETAPTAQAPVEPTTGPEPAAVAAPAAAIGTILSLEEIQRRYAATGVWQRAPGAPELGRLSETPPVTPSALAGTTRVDMPQVGPMPAQDAPLLNPPAPPPPGAVYTLDENGFIMATPEGIVTPTGAFVVLGRPEVVPPARPGTTAPQAAPAPQTPAPATDPAPAPSAGASDAAADPQSDAAQPQRAPGGTVVFQGPPPVVPPARPGTIAPPTAGALPAPAPPATSEPATVSTPSTTANEVEIIEGAPPVSPPARPGTIAPSPATDGDTRSGSVFPSDAGTTVAVLSSAPDDARPRARPQELAPPLQPVVENPFETATDQAVATSLRPTPRPSDIDRIVANARASQPTQTAEPTPVTAATIRTVRPTGTPAGTVAARATQDNALPLNRTALIGVFGSSSNRRALVRLTSGSIVRVTVGDQLDGGRVSSISNSELQYTRQGRTIRLAMP